MGVLGKSSPYESAGKLLTLPVSQKNPVILIFNA
jgi:hypothetical protein